MPRRLALINGAMTTALRRAPVSMALGSSESDHSSVTMPKTGITSSTWRVKANLKTSHLTSKSDTGTTCKLLRRLTLSSRNHTTTAEESGSGAQPVLGRLHTLENTTPPTIPNCLTSGLTATTPTSTLMLCSMTQPLSTIRWLPASSTGWTSGLAPSRSKEVWPPHSGTTSSLPLSGVRRTASQKHLGLTQKPYFDDVELYTWLTHCESEPIRGTWAGTEWRPDMNHHQPQRIEQTPKARGFELK